MYAKLTKSMPAVNPSLVIFLGDLIFLFDRGISEGNNFDAPHQSCDLPEFVAWFSFWKGGRETFQALVELF
jgi:hypothetical protein